MPVNVNASDLRDRVAFSVRATQPDVYGNVEGSWVEQFTIAARIWPRLGGETVMAARLTGRQPVTITVRRSNTTAQISPEWRAVNARNGVVYNIHSVVDPNEASPDHDRFIDILAESGVAV